MLERLFGSSAPSRLVESAFDEFAAMLRHGAEMLDLALAILLDNADLEVDLDQMDDKIDDGESKIRRMVLEHLSVQPERDLVASLVLISMVQDAERIGDFARGLGDLPALANAPREGAFADELGGLADRVRPLFKICGQAFGDDNADLARDVVEKHPLIKADLSDYIRRVAASDLDADMAIVYASTARILQRVSAHLSNIASSVVQPFDRIRHDDEDA